MTDKESWTPLEEGDKVGHSSEEMERELKEANESIESLGFKLGLLTANFRANRALMAVQNGNLDRIERIYSDERLTVQQSKLRELYQALEPYNYTRANLYYYYLLPKKSGLDEERVTEGTLNLRTLERELNTLAFWRIEASVHILTDVDKETGDHYSWDYALNGRNIRVDRITDLDGIVLYDNPDKQYGEFGSVCCVNLGHPFFRNI